jgi:hypothetical protein
LIRPAVGKAVATVLKKKKNRSRVWASFEK